MTHSVFRISVIDGALHICERMVRYADVPLDRIVRQLQSGPSDVAGYDYRAAVRLGLDVGWDAFCIEGSRQHRLRETLRELLQRIRPFWAQASFRGRRHVIDSLSIDQIQCFEVAGLLASPASDDVVAWWDGIGRFFRGLYEQSKAEIGRAGERLTLQYERRRLIAEQIDRRPIWVSVDDEGRGFDVLSYRRRDDESIGEVQIEVKASRYSPVEMYLTRPEWDYAQRHPETYIFHVWRLDKEQLREITVLEMGTSVPTDEGSGEWQSLRVTVRV